MATGDYIAKFNPRSIRKRQPFMYRDLVPDGGAKSKAAQAAAIVAGVPAAREVALANLGSGAEAAYPIQPDIYGGQDTDASSPGPTQITDPNAPQNIPSQRESTPMMGMEQQEAIANQGRGARYDADSIMGLVSSLAGTPKANEAFDSTKPIGGENVPYKPAGIFQRVLGNQANMLNLGAQQAQGAEWREADVEAQKEERLLNRIREADKPTQERFKITQAAAEKAEATRVAAENKRLELEGERLGLTKQQIEDARQDRIARLEAEKLDRDARIEDMRTRNALADAAFGRSMLPTAQAISTGQGGVLMYDQRSGQPIGTFSSPTIGEITNPDTGEKTFGPTGGGYKPYTPPVKAPVNTGGAQVNRNTGATFGGPLLDEKLPPGGGVRMGGALPAPQITPMRAAAPSPEADASLLGRFKSAMPSLSFAQPSGRGYQVAPLTEGDVAQQAMEQIAYPLRAAVAEEAKGEFENPQAAFSVLSRPPTWSLRRPGATQMNEARKAGELLRQMYAE